MGEIHVLADHEQSTSSLDYALLVPVEALEMMFPGGFNGFTDVFDAALIPDLNACAIIGADSARATMSILKEHGFEYDQDMVVIEAEINHYGPRKIHLLMSEEENSSGIRRGGEHDNS